MAKHHYVYALTSPLDYGKPFYIGKGSGDRRVQHFRSVSKEMAGAETSDKFKIIKAIRDAGLQPGATVRSHHDEEEAALTEERRVIEEIGLDNLVNKSIGGEGVKTNKQKDTKKLTGKQETFCALVAAGITGSASDCYRSAYPGGKASKKSVNEMSSALMDNPKIISRIKELRAPVVEETRYDLKWCLGRQDDATKLAEETGNAGAMTGAVREIGKLGGIYPSEKQELTLKADNLAVRLQQGRARLAEEDT
jgi:phage terminase small subunit